MAIIKKNSFKCRRRAGSARCRKKISGEEISCPVLLGQARPKNVCRRFLRQHFNVEKGYRLVCKDGKNIKYKTKETLLNIEATFPRYSVL